MRSKSLMFLVFLASSCALVACDPEEKPFEKPKLEMIEIEPEEEYEDDSDPFAERESLPAFFDGDENPGRSVVERSYDPNPPVRDEDEDLAAVLEELADELEQEQAEEAAPSEPTVTYKKVYPDYEPPKEYEFDPNSRLSQAQSEDGVRRTQGRRAQNDAKTKSERNALDTTRTYATQDAPAEEPKQVRPFIPGLQPMPGLPSIGSGGPTAEGLDESNRSGKKVKARRLRNGNRGTVVKP